MPVTADSTFHDRQMKSPLRLEGGRRILKTPASYEPGKPLISVITVVYNAESTIENAIQSVLSQTYGNIEHIVIDGGSTDGTLDILNKFDGQISYWLSEKDAGIYDAMNKGMNLATGEIVGFLNADDYYFDDSVLEQVSRALSDRQVQACYADLEYVSQDNLRVIRYWQSRPFRKGLFASGWCPPHPTFYVRKSVIEKLGGFDLTFKLAADAEFMIRYLERNEVSSRYVPRIWVRMRAGGQTNKSWANIIRQNGEIIDGLRKNGINVSFLRFFSNKLFSRAGQFLRAGDKKQ